MNRISIRGIGLAAASVAALSLAVGATTAAADAPTTTTNPTTVTVPPLSEPWAAEMAQLRAADARAAAARAAEEKAAAAKAAAAKAARDKAAAAKAAKEARAKAAQRANRSINRKPVSAGSARAIGKTLAASRGWTGQQWVCLDNLFTRESGWRTSARNGSGAYGIPQALPGSKMSRFGSDWRTNPATQIRWGLSYISGRYGTPCAAWHYFLAHRWY